MTTKSPWFLKLARPYVRRRLRRQFADVRLLGGPDLRRLIADGPVIFACNHVAWWDPLVLVRLDDFLGSDGYCLMDKDNLAELPFFRWVGAIPVDRASALAAYKDLRRASRLLDAPYRIVAIFPQGEQAPAHLPLRFKPGVSTLALSTRAPVVPLALRYDYLQGPRQVVHLSAGSPLRYDEARHTRELFRAELEGLVEQELRRIDDEIARPSSCFESLTRSRKLLPSSERIPLPASALRALTGGASHD